MNPIEELQRLAESGWICWSPAQVPDGKEKAMRAFEGNTRKYKVLVVQARIEEANNAIQHHAMMTIISAQGMAIVTLDPALSEKLYGLASDACV